MLIKIIGLILDLYITIVVILSQLLETFVADLDAFSNDAKPLGQEVSLTETKIQYYSHGAFLRRVHQNHTEFYISWF